MNSKEKDCGYTKLTLKIGDRTTTVNISGTDPSATDILEMLYGAMVGQTFLPETVIRSMQDFAESNIGEGK